MGTKARLVAIVGAAASMSAHAWAHEPAVDYQAAFARSFPAVGEEHAITDWALYEALVTGDVITYAVRLDAALATEKEGASGRAYQTQQLEGRIKHDRPLMAAFAAQRASLGSMLVSTPGGADGKPCPLAVVYVGGEFRVVLGQSSEGGDPLSHATIAPGCAQTFKAGFQITAGRSPRFKCWTTRDATFCGLRLPDMPVTLKRVVESDYPAKMTLRWRWRGVRSTVRTRYVDEGGNRVGPRAGATLTVPSALELEFVDASGHVVWVAPPSEAPAEPRPAPLASHRE